VSEYDNFTFQAEQLSHKKQRMKRYVLSDCEAAGSMPNPGAE